MAPRLSIVSVERITDELSKLMVTATPEAGLDLLVRTGVAEVVLPELPALRMEVDEHHRHKDVYWHSLTVLRQAIELEPRYGLGPDLVLRLAAILHDIGKPRTRKLLPGGKVAFHHHEMVGAQMARKRLTELRFPKDVIADVSRLVELHLRFHGYGDGEWNDSAVRRYVTDAGPLLTRLHALTRADCTTRNAKKAARLAATYDALEARIEVLREQEELDRIRPDLNGDDIMRILGLKPGPLVGKAWKFLLDLRMEEGELGAERATAELLAWAALEGIEPPPSSS
jgi:poly(A) polymerase